MTKMTTEEAFVKVLQMHGIQHAFGKRSEIGIKAEPIIPNECSIPCIWRTFTKASSVVIFVIINLYKKLNFSVFRYFLTIIKIHTLNISKLKLYPVRKNVSNRFDNSR